MNLTNLIGAPLTSGFWKSYVEAERGKRWIWNDSTYTESITRTIFRKIRDISGASAYLGITPNQETVQVLKSLRNDRPIAQLNEGMSDLIKSALMAKRRNAKYVLDITISINSLAGRQTAQGRLFEDDKSELDGKKIVKWLDEHNELFASNQITLEVLDSERWLLPSSEELHRLGDILDYPIPRTFGPSRRDKANEKFVEGNILGCAEEFAKILEDKESTPVRNNLAFCQILLGRTHEALENLNKVLEKAYEPLYEMNKGIAEFLEKGQDDAIKSLSNALQKFHTMGTRFDPRSASFVLLLDAKGDGVFPYKGMGIDDKGMAIDAAIIVNLCRMGHMKQEEMEEKIKELYPDEWPIWAESIK